MRAELAPTHITGGQIVRENLPFPIVHYPGELGVFLAFAPSRRHIPKLCACARPAVENFMKLAPTSGKWSVSASDGAVGFQRLWSAASSRGMAEGICPSNIPNALVINATASRPARRIAPKRKARLFSVRMDGTSTKPLSGSGSCPNSMPICPKCALQCINRRSRRPVVSNRSSGISAV